MVQNLPVVWQKQIESIVYENRMLYDANIETASDYNELRDRLKQRGYTNLPMGASPIINLLKFGNPPTANVSSVNAIRTMLQKRK